jgi:hypothetical protein
MQRQVAVLAEFADGDVQPVPGADLNDRVGSLSSCLCVLI